MKKGMEYTGEVESISFPNKGNIVNVRPDSGENDTCSVGQKVIVKDVLPGQTVRFVVSKKKAGKVEGKLREVITRSIIEDDEPKCPHFGACGGCSYQTVSYSNQLKLKESIVRNILDGAAVQDYIFDGITASPSQWSYRNKMEFTFGDEYKDGPLALGMHKKGSFHDIVTVSECKIIHEDYRKVVGLVLEHFADRKIPHYHRIRHDGYLRHILMRRTEETEEMLVAIVTTKDKTWESRTELDLLKSKILDLDLKAEIKGIIHIINDNVSDTVQCDEKRMLYGVDYITEELLGLKFKISLFSFFQTNSRGAALLYGKVREYAGETRDKNIFDLYSGTGTIAQILAPFAKTVTGVEIVKEAVDAAVENAADNGLDNCRFIVGDVLKVVDDLKDKPDIIVLDPPRDGINKKALEKIISFETDRIVYISCKPTSLRRDLEILQEGGYRIERACAVDMFPNTTHVETVCLLNRQNMVGG